MTQNPTVKNFNRDQDSTGLSPTISTVNSNPDTFKTDNLSNVVTQPEANNHQNKNSTQPSLVPKGITIGLAIFSFILSIAGYGFRLITGDTLQEVLKHAAVLVPIFVIGIPLFFWLGALILNKIKGLQIQRRNALSLGWLLSCVTMLWLMGTYS